jgi:hypothetical protein
MVYVAKVVPRPQQPMMPEDVEKSVPHFELANVFASGTPEWRYRTTLRMAMENGTASCMQEAVLVHPSRQ